MEGLCRQKAPESLWEVEVCEEQLDGMAGRSFYESYWPRLAAIGCVRIKYVPIYARVPLSIKWRTIAQHAHEDSRMMLLQAVDDFSHPQRLRDTETALNRGAMWYHTRYGMFYNILTGTVMEYDHSSLTNGKFKTGLHIAFSTPWARLLPKQDVYSGVDGWLYNSLMRLTRNQMTICYDENRNHTKGVFTDGMNTISQWRRNRYAVPRAPFRPSEVKISEVIPGDIIKRLVQ